MDFFHWWGTINWGDAAGWVSGVATSAAFIFSIWQLSRERRRRHCEEQRRVEEGRRAQAAQITAWFDRPGNSILVRNDSGAVIYDVLAVLILNNRDDWTSFKSEAMDFSRLMRVVPPRTTVRAEIGQGWAGMSAVPYAKLTFRDANGATWTRSTSGSLHEDDQDVFAKYGLVRPYPYHEPQVMTIGA